ncbi:hypothetical protein BDZ45DRAFT_744206 [Acephala macrosclerotiorum]|nr:hypothetical protein BDZ45DRAFT_744206 [Acephala macrosclerotiorum]
MLSSSFCFAAILLVSASAASPNRRLHAEPADGIATDICGWVRGDPGAQNEFLGSYLNIMEVGNADHIEWLNLGRPTVHTNSGETAEPLCATYLYPNSVTELRCVSSIPSQLSIEYAHTGFSTPLYLPRVIHDIIPPSSTSSASTSSSSGSPSSSPMTSSGQIGTSTSTQSPSSSRAPAAPKSSKTNTGATAGGAVGGVVALAALGILLFFFRKNLGKKKHVQEIAHDRKGYPDKSHPPGYNTAPPPP